MWDVGRKEKYCKLVVYRRMAKVSHPIICLRPKYNSKWKSYKYACVYNYTLYMKQSTRTQNTFTLHRQQLYRRINTNTPNAFGRINFFFRPISIQLPYYFVLPLALSLSLAVLLCLSLCLSSLALSLQCISKKTRWQESIIDSFFFLY